MTVSTPEIAFAASTAALIVGNGAAAEPSGSAAAEAASTWSAPRVAKATGAFVTVRGAPSCEEARTNRIW